HRTREHGPEDHVRITVERLLHLCARHTGIALRVRLGRYDLAAEDAALRIDLVDGEHRAIAKVRTRYGTGSRELDDDRHVDGLLRGSGPGQCAKHARDDDGFPAFDHGFLEVAFKLQAPMLATCDGA